jgi:hypothetical protein
MISVSESWKNAHKGALLPESFIEISIGVADPDARDLTTASCDSNALFSKASNVVGEVGAAAPANYATLEHNLWLLDGSRNVVPATAPYSTPGYVSADDTLGGVTLSLSEVRNQAIPGFVITWSSEYGEYPTAFTVEAKNGDSVVASVSVTDNATNVTEVPLEIAGYDKVVIRIQEWNYPDHRARLDRIYFGHIYMFGKKDVIDYTHEQYGCLLSGELPKASIAFSLDNVDGKWNPMNPFGLGKYISERQRVTVRYGMNVDDAIEWIQGGVFYLTGWRAPSNGLTAHFEARDIFEFLLNTEYTGVYSGTMDNKGTLDNIVRDALSLSDLPTDFVVSLDPHLGDIYGYKAANDSFKVAEMLQLCANAACCVVYQDRDGVLRIEPLNKKVTDYYIGSNVSYSHPEIELTKPLKAVHVISKYDLTVVLPVASSGEIQTVNNAIVDASVDGVSSPKDAIAQWTRDMLEKRTVVTGEFRGDPRLDVFDVVAVESKYGVIFPVVITDIKYSYSGAFRASYSGRALAFESEAVLDEFILDEDVLS